MKKILIHTSENFSNQKILNAILERHLEKKEDVKIIHGVFENGKLNVLSLKEKYNFEYDSYIIHSNVYVDKDLAVMNRDSEVLKENSIDLVIGFYNHGSFNDACNSFFIKTICENKVPMLIHII